MIRQAPLFTADWRRSFGPVLAVVLSVVLALGTATMAVARGQATGGGDSVVICSGYGVVTITLDADGNPTGPVHPCPDCLAGLGLALLPDAPLVLRPSSPARLLVWAPEVAWQGHDRPAPKARGPPSSV